jgi:hypothetical protein
LAWADGLPGGRAVAGAAAFEVRWRDQLRLVAEPAAQLDGLADEDYDIEVRSIDPFGRRSAPVRVSGRPLNSAPALPGYTDEFDSTDSIHSEVAGSRWHVSAYRGCVDLAGGTAAKIGQLGIQLACGADDVVMRSRSALQIGPDARVTVVTDAAGPRSELNIEFVPGPADRIGSRTTGTPALPAGAIHVSISDSGVEVVTGSSVPRGGTAPVAVRPARRGSEVLHRFDVSLTPEGIRVYQDSVLVGGADVLAPWPSATVLVGMAGPKGRQSTIYVDAIALSSVVPADPPVVEFEASMGTQRVLRPAENAPGIGVARWALVGATSARLKATVTLGAGTDPLALSLQIGDRLLPLVPATPGPPAVAGTDVTLVADLPPDVLVGEEPSSLSPLVIRGPGSAAVLQSYLEIVPGPASPPFTRRRDPQLKPLGPRLPTTGVKFLDASGRELGKTVPGSFKAEITLEATGAVAPVRGFEVFVEDRLIASVPTDLDGPAAGGKYVLAVALPDQLPGEQTLDVRVHPVDGNPQSTVVAFTLVS